MSTEEKTGIQALERAPPRRPLRPGLGERQEVEDIGHGTQTLIANCAVATGQGVAPTVGPTRTAADFAAPIEQRLQTDPQAGWSFLVAQLTTPQAESLVRLGTQHCQREDDWGIKGETGSLRSLATRAAFVQDPAHRIRFVSMPNHTSWLNQGEIWFSIVVRRVLQRGNFSSTEALRQRRLAFITYVNQTLAKPFKWTYAGRPLAA